MKKPINIRLEEDIVKIIERQDGNTFTEKFVNLVLKLDLENSSKENKIKILDIEISKKEKRLHDISNCLNNIGIIQRRW